MNILSKIQAFSNKLQSDISDGRFGISRTDRQLATLFSGAAKMTIIIIDCCSAAVKLVQYSTMIVSIINKNN